MWLWFPGDKVRQFEGDGLFLNTKHIKSITHADGVARVMCVDGQGYSIAISYNDLRDLLARG